MRQGRIRVSLAALLLIQIFAGASYAQRLRPIESVLIQSSKPYDNLIRAIEAQGGTVTHQFNHVDGISAEIPTDAIAAIRALPGVASVEKDIEVPRPSSVNAARSRNGNQATSLSLDTAGSLNRLSSKELAKLATTNPGIYSINNAGTNIGTLHAQGFTGEGTIVAVIDSGVRMGFKLVQDSIIGGVDFVDDGAPGPAGDGNADWKQASNDGHGTLVAGLIAGNASFTVNRVMKDALMRYVPDALIDNNLPLVGTAPNAKIYVVRVFGDDASTGAKLQTILAAIDHVIDQRELYESSGGHQGLKISVVNLSLGVSTLAAGRTLLDTEIDRLLQAGIVPVISAGDVGPSALTTSSPGSSMSAITVGGISRAANERILNEVVYATQFAKDYFPGIGEQVRPFPGTETAWFSSRGPNADGRPDPDVVASAVGNIGQGYCPDDILEACFKQLTIGNGTSFSAPIISGIAAVLTQAFPNATATQIRNAIIASGKTNQIENYFDDADRGHGLPDAQMAYQLLQGGLVPDSLPQVTPPNALVRVNIEQNTPLVVKTGSPYSQSLTGLKPGQRGEILYDVPCIANQVNVTVNNVVMHAPQNTFVQGGNGLFVYVHSAKTSSIGAVGDYRVNGALLLNGDVGNFAITNPDLGVMRITLNPDTLNAAGAVDADVLIETMCTGPKITIASGTIDTGETKSFAVPISSSAPLEFLLTFDHDWAHYPTSDVDMIVCSPDISAADCPVLGNKKGATLAAPERASIPSPAIGTWTVLVKGFNIPHPPFTLPENFQLHVRQ